MSSTLPISKIAWPDSWLNVKSSFDRSSRIQILFEPIFLFFDRFCICVCDFFSHSFALQECIRADLFVAEMRIHVHVRSGMPQFLGGEVRFCGVVRNVLCSSLVFPFVISFQRLSTSVLEVECCCSWLCPFFST